MAAAMPTEDMVRDALREVIDPEVHLNIVDLGLIYAVEIGDGEIRIIMTMTTPACPVGPMLTGQVETVLKGLAPKGARIAVDLVWDPPWHPGMMSEMAKTALGWSL